MAGRGSFNVFIKFSRLVRSAMAFAVATLAVGSAQAMRVSPMIVEMTTTGTDAVSRVEVQNLNAGRLPFETRVTRVTFNEKGEASETPADEDFIIFPPQGILPQGARQVVRLQWVGGADIPTSRAYYLSVNQLPIPDNANSGAVQSGQVQVVYHMKALVVVAPKDATPDVSATAVKQIEYQPAAEKDGGPLPPKVPGVEITMQNKGRRHAMMSALKWIIDGKDSDGKPMRFTIVQEELNKLVGSGYVAGQSSRIFQIPVAKAFGTGPITVKFLP